MQKTTLRTQIAALRDALSPAQWRSKSDTILRHLRACDAYHTAACVFTFISIQNEVDTRALLSAAWEDGKRIAVPVTAEQGVMYFVPITPSTALHTTRYGTLEPAASAQDAIIPCSSDLFLVPGLVFDLQGNRYGYGGGFYDRYLAQNPQAVPVALAFECQVYSETLSAQSHDIPMKHLITEEGWRNLS